jgi:hypothetical protein
MTMQLPAALAHLKARLGEWGFEFVSEQASESFGDRSIVLAKPPLEVRLVGDRGQWFINCPARAGTTGSILMYGSRASTTDPFAKSRQRSTRRLNSSSRT